MTTKQQRNRIRQAAVNGERKERRKDKLAHEARGHDPYWFGLRLLTTINDLATNVRRIKRDKVAPHLLPEDREAIAEASRKLAPLLATLPDLMRHPEAPAAPLPVLPAPEVQQ